MLSIQPSVLLLRLLQYLSTISKQFRLPAMREEKYPGTVFKYFHLLTMREEKYPSTELEHSYLLLTSQQELGYRLDSRKRV